MSWLRVIALRFLGQFRKSRLETDLRDELHSHIEMLAEENVSRGLGPEAARDAAARTFGAIDVEHILSSSDRWNRRVWHEVTEATSESFLLGFVQILVSKEQHLESIKRLPDGINNVWVQVSTETQAGHFGAYSSRDRPHLHIAVIEESWITHYVVPFL